MLYNRIILPTPIPELYGMRPDAYLRLGGHRVAILDAALFCSAFGIAV